MRAREIQADVLGVRVMSDLRELTNGGHPQTIVLVISHARNPNGERKAGIYVGYVGDELIVSSRQPFLDGARELLKRGYDPATPYDMRHANSATLSFVTTTIGHAAGLSVNEARPRFQKFIPFDPSIKEAAE